MIRALGWGLVAVALTATTAAAQDAAASGNLALPGDLTADVRGELEASIAAYERAVALLFEKGPKETRQALDASIDRLEEIRKRDGRCALPEYYLGIAYQLLGLYWGDDPSLEKAVVRLKAAVRLNKAFHEAWVELGDAHGHVDHQREAAAAYDAAIELAPDYALAYERRATLHLMSERYAEARADLIVARKLKPDDEALKGFERQLALVIDGPDWPQKFETETKNYLVRTNVSQDFADFIAERAELIRRLYLSIFPDPPKTKRKFPIVVYASAEEYHAGGGPPTAGGHYEPLFKQLVLFKYEKVEDTLIVLHHEGFHQFFDGILETKAPQWVDEGLGDFFGPSEQVAGGMKLRPNPWRLRTVQQMIRAGRTVPFERLMTMTQQEMYGDDAGLHYAQAWAIVYFLCQADDRAHFKYLKKYFKALRRNKGRFEAFEDAFGSVDMAALEARWRDFILGL